MSTINFPELPLELERLIFEFAVAQNDSIKASTPLLLVAKRVCEWLRPLIFRVINYTRSTVSSKAPQSIGPFVQHLIIDGSLINVSLLAILSSCPNIISLAIQRSYMGNLRVLVQEMSRLTRLAVGPCRVSCRVLPYDESLIQTYLNLTHLSIHGPRVVEPGREWEFLAHLPKLTHICLDNAIQDHIPKVLLLCPLLKLFVVASFVSYINLEDLGDVFLVDDNRLVLMVRQSYNDQVLDWERGANGGVDLWIFAERVVFARSRKYFARPLPKLIPRDLEWEIYLNEDGKRWFHEL